MAQHRLGAFTHHELAVLISPAGQAVSAGQLAWRFTNPRCMLGVLQVSTGFDDPAKASALQIYIKQPAPSEPEMQYMVRGVAVRRCDVNGNHGRGRHAVRFTTHKHTYDPATGAEGCYIPDDIPEVPLAPTVVHGVYRSVFDAFAEECHVALQDGYWTDPPS